jgi:hypothetical protein
MTQSEHNPWVILLLVYLSSVMGLGSAHGSAEVARADSVQRSSAAGARGSHWKQVRRKTTYYHRYDMLC